jgi:hypothetical protein
VKQSEDRKGEGGENDERKRYIVWTYLEEVVER